MAGRRKSEVVGGKVRNGLREVAALAGIGIATASSVLNNSQTNTRVSAATRQRILDAARELKYHPNALARALTGQPTKTIGVLFGLERVSIAVANPYAFSVLQGIIGASAEADYNVTLYTRPWHGAAQSAAPMRDRRTDGVVLIAVPTGADVVPSLVEIGLPIVSISSSGDQYGVPSVDVDNAAGGRMATEHLIGLGHRRIALLRGDDNLENANQRREAFNTTLDSANIAQRPEFDLSGSYEAESGYARTKQLLALSEPPTAIFASNDVLAQACIEAARDCGVRVPEQLSVVGFDDIPLAPLLTPPLTTVRQPLTEIGAAATKMLIELLGGATLPSETQTFAPELVIRSSTCPPVAT